MLRPHRRPGFSCAQPGLRNKQTEKKDAERRKTQTYPPQLALRRAPCRARSPSGVPPRLCPWDSRIPRCDFGPGFAERAPKVAGVSRRRPPRLQRAPRTPVIMPADMMSETARERRARPSAGAVLARRSGLPPDRLLHGGEDPASIINGDNVKDKVTKMMIRDRGPLAEIAAK